MITPADIRIAQHVIYDSGAADKFRDALTSDKRGRKPTFDQSLFLLGCSSAPASTAKPT